MDKIEGLQICLYLVEITSIRNMSRNTSNEWNEVNCIEELKRTRNFVLTHDESKLRARGRNNKDGTTLWEKMTMKGEKYVMSSTMIERGGKNSSKS